MKITKSQFWGVLAFCAWVPIPWIYFDPPNFLAGQPLAIYAVTLFLSGLSAAASVLLIALRSRLTERAARVYVFLFVLAFVGAYQFSGLAPSWQCFGKKLQAAVGRAEGQNCTTTCTNNDKKPCSGWSSCWDKFVSCSADGIDQGGRNCQGCCFSCDVICEDPDPPTYQPPTIGASVECFQPGSNGWCTSSSFLALSAYDPQGDILTISGDIAGVPFTCLPGPLCNRPLSEGQGTINYQVVASQSGLAASGFTTWKNDATPPTAKLVFPAPTGSNGWFTTTPLVVSITGSDSLSGLSTAELSLDNNRWQSSASLSSEGSHRVYYRAFDLAGNLMGYSPRIIFIDTIPPTISNWSFSGNVGLNDWYTSPVDINVTATDATSGLDTLFLYDNGISLQTNRVSGNGVHHLVAAATDRAGHFQSASYTLRVDTDAPIITLSILGRLGRGDNWYVSNVTVDATASDNISGMQGNVQVSLDKGSTWMSLPIHLDEGIHTLDFRAFDKAGNLSTISRTVKVDTALPVFTMSTTGTLGDNGWYITDVTTTIIPSDLTSGIDRVEFNPNNNGWQQGASIVSKDGLNSISIRVYDAAGNMAGETLQVKIDTVAPVVIPSLPVPDGSNGWFVSAPVPVSATSFDSGSGLASSGVSINEEAWAPVLSLKDGVYTLEFKAIDNAGNSTSVSQPVKIDTVPPLLSTSIEGTEGSTGWYVSPTTTTISARDETSGIERIEYAQNKKEWRAGSSVVSKDGINDIFIRTYDLAGNLSSDSIQVKVDPEKPSSTFTSPPNGSTNTVIRGKYALSGSSLDRISGVAGAEILLDGKNWLPVVVASDGKWSYEWDTSTWADGVYPVVVRATDHAGNRESSEAQARATLIVNNTPPHIKLTPEWFIWQSGALVIKTGYFPVRDGIITIADREGRWPSVKIPFEAKYPSQITWDRKFANGVLAPSGDYRVTVSACNIYDLCSEKSAIIRIPWYSAVVPTLAASTQMVEVIQEPKTQIKEPLATALPPAVERATSRPEKEIQVERHYESTLSLLPIVILIALLWVVSSAALADERPAAIRAIAETITPQKYKGEY